MIYLDLIVFYLDFYFFLDFLKCLYKSADVHRDLNLHGKWGTETSNKDRDGDGGQNSKRG